MYSLKRACDKLLGGVSKRTLTLILALTVTMATAAGGTLAFLYGTQEVKNTFTYDADVRIDLEETDTQLDIDENPHTNAYEMIPGQNIHKDPTVTVFAGSMDCWLFVEVAESLNFADFMAYTVADGWAALEGVPGVFYCEVASAEEDQLFPVLQDNLIYMKESVTLSQLASLTEADYPRLTIKAYAIQRDASIPAVATASSAWATLGVQ